MCLACERCLPAEVLTGLGFGLQMGGPEGVEAQETNRLTLQPGNGLFFNCVPRGVKSEAPLAPSTPERAESPPPRVVY